MRSKVKSLELEILSAISGIFIAFQSRVNGELSHRVGDSLTAACISFLSGFIVVSLIAFSKKSVRTGFSKLRAAVSNGQIPKYRLFAGALGATFVAVQTYSVPVIGVALFTVSSLAGQTVMSLFVDRAGLTGGGRKEIDKARIISATVTVFAVFISCLDRLNLSEFSFFAVLLGLFAGGLVAFQRAFNGQINEFTGQSFATSWLNFLTGCTFLLILFLVKSIFSETKIPTSLNGPIWIYLGGTIGVMYIAFSAKIVQEIGVLVFTMVSVGGLLFGSLLIDLFLPTRSVGVSIYLIIGIVVAYFGVLISGQSRVSRR